MPRWFPILILALAACAEPFAPPAELEYGVGFGTMPAATRDAPAVSGRRGEILISGVVPRPNGCQGLRGHVERDGRELLVRIIARSRAGGPCEEGSTGFAYQVMARGLERGAYRVRIFHVYEDVEWPASLAFDEVVSVR